MTFDKQSNGRRIEVESYSSNLRIMLRLRRDCRRFDCDATAVGLQLNGSVKEPNMFHNYETKKIICKASDTAENVQLYRVVRFFHHVRRYIRRT